MPHRAQAPAPEGKTERRRENSKKDSGRRRTLAVLALAAAAVATLVLLGPIKRNLQASAELGAKQHELEAERAETRDLQMRREQANDIGFIMRQARRLGYVLAGEIPVIVVQEEAAQPDSPTEQRPPGSP